ncbi:hypothetical protein OEZ85_005121 [Tetradesmus obliquus]|uniref:Beta/gamma crystallin 'Greek key' domain-containing protein n=1 Tax=Tetradesmus obliquus TaxID=3088 RepID=A0ABY8UJA8_TETOB|nr:hypothetical protein OEZ85_005121 [Tetradesmus obliquus]
MALLALLGVFMSPACGSARERALHQPERALLQDQPTQVVQHVAAGGSNSGRRASRRPIILAVPGNGLGAAAAVVPAQTSTITMYEHCNYAGRAVVAAAGNYPQLPSPWNDFVSSVRVPLGLAVTLRENINYGGRGLTITGPSDIPCLTNWQFNDITSSMRVVSTSPSGGSTGSNSTTGGGGSTGSGGIDSQLLILVNTARRQAGLREISINTLLNTAAQAHSQDQARTQTMSHVGSDGSTFDVRITRAGYRWRAAAENVAAGYSSVQSVFDGWMGSAGHRANILGDFMHMGLGAASGGNGVMYWTQLFATPM